MSHKIYTYSVIHTAAEAFKAQVPYVIALIDLPDGSRTMAQIDGYHADLAIHIGMAVTPLSGEESGRYRF